MDRIAWMAAILSYVIAGQAHSHEVWIEPQDWTVSTDEGIKAHVKNGEHLEGNNLVWDDRGIVRAEVWADGMSTPIEGRLGDRPALSVPAPSDGLVTLLYQSDHRTIVYQKFDKFSAFVHEKGYESVLASHAERGLSQATVKEAFIRFAKALVAVGPGDGSDAARGMELELVALDNPYQLSDADMMTVQLLYQGEPLAENRVTVFRRDAEDTVDTLLIQSDAEGKVQFPLDAGTTYLVDSVVLREPSRDLVVSSRGAVWESLWASLTFQVAADQ